jgi:hypothetical protein
MRLDWRTTAVIAGLLLSASTAAHAVVLDDKSPAQKLRADISRQVLSYMKCLANVQLACEKTGILPAPECNLATGTAVAPADPKGTFAGQIAKCDAKLDFDKKGPKGNSPLQNYELIGCPSWGAGVRFPSMAQFQAAAGFLKATVTGFVGNVTSASGCTDNKTCKTDGKLIFDFIKAVSACQTACENDYKDKKGNGGPTDSTTLCEPNGNLTTQVCILKAFDKFSDKAVTWPSTQLAAIFVIDEVDELNDGLFNAPAACN